MDEAFLSLIEKKDFSYITIKEICERAGVNRSTFYLHYELLADLLEESTQYITAIYIVNKKINLKSIVDFQADEFDSFNM